MDYVHSTLADGVLTVRLNRPDKLNALTHDMYTTLAQIFSGLNSDSAVRAVILRGGEHFTAGNDLDDFLQNPPLDTDAPVFRFMRAIIELEAPLIAVVSGAAIGIGTTLLAHCDVVIATKTSKLGVPFVRLGLTPEFAATLMLPGILGTTRASQLLLCGDFFSGEQAAAWGLANETFETAEQCLEEANKKAGQFVKAPQGALRRSKQLLRSLHLSRVKEVLHNESLEFISQLQTQETQRALRSMLRA